MEIDRAIGILDKWEFFYGQRAGRELWADKPTEVQNEDIANFCRDLGFVRESLERTRWIPCSERLPAIGEGVLVYSRNSGMSVDYYDRGLFGFVDVTHWMPLPELPEEG
nr:MAG TPA: Protein of unknown function (DUF551) [Caudoviricetes sp.]